LATMPRAVASERTSLTRVSFPYPNESASCASGRRGLAGRSLGGQERAALVPAPFLPDRVGHRGGEEQPLGVGIGRVRRDLIAVAVFDDLVAVHHRAPE